MHRIYARFHGCNSTRRATVHNSLGRTCECASPAPLMMVIINGPRDERFHVCSQLTCPKCARLTSHDTEDGRATWTVAVGPVRHDLAQGKLKSALSICLLVFFIFEAILKSNRTQWFYDKSYYCILSVYELLLIKEPEKIGSN